MSLATVYSRAQVGVNSPQVTIEVHLSNVYSREACRHKALIAPVVSGQISGFGKKSYFLGMDAIIGLLKK